MAQLKQLLQENAALVAAKQSPTARSVNRGDGRFPDTFFTKGIKPFERYANYVVRRPLDEVLVQDAVADVSRMLETCKDKDGREFGASAKANYVAHLIDALALPEIKAAMDPAQYGALLTRWTDVKSAAVRQRPPRGVCRGVSTVESDEGPDEGPNEDPVALFAELGGLWADPAATDEGAGRCEEDGRCDDAASSGVQARLDTALRRNKRLVAALELCAGSAAPNEAAWIRHVLALINEDDAEDTQRLGCKQIRAK